jgi:(p)ppGpp synthase/HD superfamily hydrolase
LVEKSKNVPIKEFENEKEPSLNNKRLIIWWEVWLDYKLCNCVKRKLPKDIVAHINNKWTITIHRRNCKVLNDVNKDRLLSACIYWEEDEFLVITVKIVVQIKNWVLKNITDTVFNMLIEVDSLHSRKIWNLQTEIILDLKILDYDYLIIDRFIDRIKLKLKELYISSEVLWVKKI